ncbi:MAG: VOC family protein [Propionibacteriaceae bacterium]|nr:VOC family protein [Propionibacteriaceae bacterium]
MHLDHLIYAVGPLGLEAEAARLESLLQVKSVDGGIHPSFGTRIRLIPLVDSRHIEIVEVLDHPAAEKVPYGQAVRTRSSMGGGWLGWVISMDDLSEYEARLDRTAVQGVRHFPDGRLLEWQQLGVKGLIADPQLPFFIRWISEPSVLPSALPASIALDEIQIAGSRERVAEWLGSDVPDVFDHVTITFDSPSGYPGVVSATFRTTSGLVRI